MVMDATKKTDLLVKAATHKPYSCKLINRGWFGKHIYDIIFDETPIRRVFMDREDVESYLSALNGAWLIGWHSGFSTASDYAIDTMKKELAEQLAAASWKGEVDRQSGAFSQDEIDAWRRQ